MRFFWPDSYPILKRPGLNALRNAFQTDINLIAQTTSGGGGLGRIPDETGQVYMHLVVETTYGNFTTPKILKY